MSPTPSVLRRHGEKTIRHATSRRFGRKNDSSRHIAPFFRPSGDGPTASAPRRSDEYECCGADFGWSLRVRRCGRGAECGCEDPVVEQRGCEDPVVGSRGRVETVIGLLSSIPRKNRGNWARHLGQEARWAGLFGLLASIPRKIRGNRARRLAQGSRRAGPFGLLPSIPRKNRGNWARRLAQGSRVSAAPTRHACAGACGAPRRSLRPSIRL
jgi:hypothetical protein